MIDLYAEFNYFNAKLFNNELPSVPVKFNGRMKKSGGTCKYKRTILTNIYIDGTATISIASSYQNDRKAVQAILIHEMIHLYFVVKNHHAEGHGENFRKLATKFSKIVGFTIPVDSCKFDHEVMEVAMRKQPIGVLICTKKDGNKVFAMMTEKLAYSEGSHIKERLLQGGNYTDIRIEITTDPKILLFSRSVKVNRKISSNFSFYVMTDTAAESLNMTEYKNAA